MNCRGKWTALMLISGFGLQMQASPDDQHRRSASDHYDSAYDSGGPYSGDRRHDNRSNAHRNGTSYGRLSGSPVDRALYNLNVAAANSRVDGHENGHFKKAQQELSKFQARWAQGNFDTGRLDRAIGSMQDLANSNQLNVRDRSILANDLAALRQFRSTRGQDYGSYGNSRYDLQYSKGGSYRNSPYSDNRHD